MILIQFTVAIFAIILALWNRRRELEMIKNGATKQQENIFHDICGALKIIVAASIWYYTGWWVTGLISLFLMWFTFDIFNNIFVGINKWYYIGTHAWMDRQVNKLGKNAGKIKAAICCAVVVILSMLKHK